MSEPALGLAFQLSGGSDIDGTQLLVEARQSF